MSLTRWFRKNNKKLMAVVVIILMIGFVGSAWLGQLRNQRSVGKQTIAKLADGEKITGQDFQKATDQLEILKALQLDVALREIGLNSPNLRAVALKELLFPEPGTSGQMAMAIKQVAAQKNYTITNKQINAIYEKPVTSPMMWLLLNKEIERAGIRGSADDAGRFLGQVIPQLFPQATYSQVMSTLISQMNVSENYILNTTADLLSILNYSSMISLTENVTNTQAIYQLSRTLENLNAKAVEIDSAMFTEDMNQPLENQLSEQFDKYKHNFPGNVTNDNPYGFGYKLHDLVGLEYMVVRLEDVKKTIPQPSEEEKEEYYQQNRNSFVVSVPVDPNDPNSPTNQQIQSYPQVAHLIGGQIIQEKANAKAQKALIEAKDLSEEKIIALDTEYNELTSSQFRQNVVDYKAVAEKVSQNHNIKIYTGQTGLLNAEEINQGQTLPFLYLQKQGAFTGVVQLAFSVDPLNITELGPLEPGIRQYENIGPLNHAYQQSMGLIRVVEAKPAAAPESLDQVISKKGIMFAANPEVETYSVKQQVAEDIKLKAAFEKANTVAQNMAAAAKEKGWDSALSQFNEKYGKKSPADPNIVQDVFELEDLSNLRRMSAVDLTQLKKQAKENPLAKIGLIDRQKDMIFVDQLYDMVPADSNTVENLPVITEFKPDFAVYVIEDIELERFTQSQYEQIKPRQADMIEAVQSQNLAFVYFNPENIIKRTGFEWVEEYKSKQQPTGPNEPNAAQAEAQN